MRYGVLGPLLAVHDGHDVTPRGRRARDVLAVLLLRRNQPVHPLALLDLVWDDEAVSLDAAVVHTVVARLRRTLGPDAVETTPLGYRVGSAPVDDVEFTGLVARARAEPHRSVALLREGLALWRSVPAYADISERLVSTERPRLHEQRQAAAEALAEALLRTGEPESTTEAFAVAEGLAAEEPLRERAHELVMLAAYRAGRQADALAAYDRMRRMLRGELGVDPGPSAVRLQARILAQDPGLMGPDGPPRPSASPRTAPPTPAPPAPATALIGREDELRTAHRSLRSRRVVTLCGPGGVGKSRLLAELYWKVRDDRPVGYLDLAGVGAADRDEMAEAVAGTLGITLTPADPVGSLADALLHRDLTLFLDEAEFAGPAAAEVTSQLLRACPRLSVVASSRRELGVLGERRVAVDPLPCPAPDAEVATILASPAVRLLTERLVDQAGGDLGGSDPFALAEVARRVDGLPLALELVAGYAGSRSIGELVDLLAAPLDLEATEPDRPARHRSLRETILWSADRLPDADRRVLRRLGVFVGTFDLAAAAAVVGPGLGDVAATCRSLAREALIQVGRRSDGTLGWRLLRTVRDLAIEGLEEESDLAATRARHRDWHAARWRGALRSDNLIADLSRHHDDYVAALRSALAVGDKSTLGDLVLTLGRWWVFTDAVGPGLRWIGRALDSGLLGDAERARVLVQRASLMMHQDPEESLRSAAAAVATLEEAGDHAWLVGAHLIQGLERYSSGDLASALEHARRAVHSARCSTDERLADALGVLAVVEAATADEASALRTVEEAWALAHGSGSAAAMASVANNLCLTLLEFGHTDEALRMLDTVGVTLGDLEMPLFLTHTSGWVLLSAGDPSGALARFADVVRATPEAVADRRAAESYAGAACALAALDVAAPAADLLTGACELIERLHVVLPRWITTLIDAAGEPGPGSGSSTTEELGSRLAGIVLAHDPRPDAGRTPAAPAPRRQPAMGGSGRTPNGPGRG